MKIIRKLEAILQSKGKAFLKKEREGADACYNHILLISARISQRRRSRPILYHSRVQDTWNNLFKLKKAVSN